MLKDIQINKILPPILSPRLEYRQSDPFNPQTRCAMNKIEPIKCKMDLKVVDKNLFYLIVFCNFNKYGIKWNIK